MDQDRYRIYISSESSKDLHPQNELTDFVFELPRPLLLDGKWEVAIHEAVSNVGKGGRMFVCTDLCTEAVADGKLVPILAKMRKRGTYTQPLPLYADVRGIFVKRIRVYMLDEDLRPFSAPAGSFNCVISLRRVYK